MPKFSKPVILGHEFGGVIETPSEGSKFSKGDLVSVDPNIVCGVCIDCKAGRTAFCPTLTALGVNITGGLAEFVLVPDTQIYRVSNSLNPLHLAFKTPVANNSTARSKECKTAIEPTMVISLL